MENDRYLGRRRGGVNVGREDGDEPLPQGVGSSSAQVEELMQQIHTLRNRLIERESIIVHLTEDKTKADSEIQGLRQEAEDLDKALATAKQALEGTNQAIEQVKATAQNDKLESQQKYVVELKEMSSKLEEERSAWSAERTKQLQHEAEVDLKLQSSTQECRALQRRVERAESDFKESVQAVGSLRGELRTKQGDAERKTKENVELGRVRQELENQLEQFKRSNDDLARKHQGVQDKLKETLAKVSQLSGTVQENERLRKEVKRLGEAEAECSKAEAKLADLNVKHALQEGRLGEMAKLTDRLQATEEALAKHRDEKMSWKSEQLELKAKVRLLEEDVRDKETLKAKVAGMEALKHENFKLDFAQQQLVMQMNALKKENERFATVQETLKDCRRETLALQATNAQLAEKNTRLNDTMEACKRDLETKRTELGNAQVALRDKSQTAERESLRLQDAQRTAQEKVERAFEMAQHDWGRERAQVERDVAALEDALANRGATIAELEKELSQANAMRESANERYAKLEEEVQARQGEMVKSKEDLERQFFANDEKYRERFNQQHQKMVAMQSERYEAMSEAKGLANQLKREKEVGEEERGRLMASNRHLEEQLKETTRKIDVVQQEYTNAKVVWATERGHYEGNVKMYESQIEMLKRNLKDAQDGATMSQVSMGDLRRHSESWKKDQHRLRSEIRQHEIVREELEQSKMSLESEVLVLKEEIENREKETKAMKQAFKDLKSASTSSLQNLQQTLDRNKRNFLSAEKKWGELKQRLETQHYELENGLSLKSSEVKHMLDKHESYALENKSKIEHYQRTIERHRETVTALTKDLKKAQENLASVNSEHNHLQIKFENTTQRLRDDADTLRQEKDEFKIKYHENKGLLDAANIELAREKEISTRLELSLQNNTSTLVESKEKLQQAAMERNNDRRETEIVCASLRKQIEALESEKTALKSAIVELKHQSSEKGVENNAAVLRLEENLKHTKENLSNELNRCKQDLKESKIFHDAAKESWERSLEKLTSELKEKDLKIQQMRTKLEEQVHNHSQLKMRVIAQLEKAGRQMKEKSGANERLAAKAAADEVSKSQAIERYESLRKQAEESQRRLMAEIESAQNRESQVRSEMTTAKLEMQDLRRRLESAEANVMSLKDLQGRLVSAERELGEKNVEINDLKNNLWKERERGEQAALLHRRLGVEKEEKERALKEADRQKKINTDLRARVKTKEQELKEIVSEHELAMDSTVRKFKTGANEALAKLETSKMECSSLQSQLERVQSELALSKSNADASIKDAESVAQAALTKIETLQSGSAHAQSAIKEMQSRMILMQGQLGAAQQEASLAREESTQKNNEINYLSSSAETLKHANSSLLHQLDGVKEDFHEFLSRSSSLMSPHVKSILMSPQSTGLDRSASARLLLDSRRFRSFSGSKSLDGVSSPLAKLRHSDIVSPNDSLTMSTLQRDLLRTTPIGNHARKSDAMS